MTGGVGTWEVAWGPEQGCGVLCWASPSNHWFSVSPEVLVSCRVFQKDGLDLKSLYL